MGTDVCELNSMMMMMFTLKDNNEGDTKSNNTINVEPKRHKEKEYITEAINNQNNMKNKERLEPIRMTKCSFPFIRISRRIIYKLTHKYTHICIYAFTYTFMYIYIYTYIYIYIYLYI
jgi:phage terminase Nu1 subunit (DNA packaging protein)